MKAFTAVLSAIALQACAAQIVGDVNLEESDDVSILERRLFFTGSFNTAYGGDISTLDSACASAALSAGLVRRYRAVARTQSYSPWDNLDDSRPVYTISKTHGKIQVLDRLSDLRSGASPIILATSHSQYYVSASGNYLGSLNIAILTGMTSSGEYSSDNCSHWTDNTTGGLLGATGDSTQTGSGLIYQNSFLCSAYPATLRVMCVSD